VFVNDENVYFMGQLGGGMEYSRLNMCSIYFEQWCITMIASYILYTIPSTEATIVEESTLSYRVVLPNDTWCHV